MSTEAAETSVEAAQATAKPGLVFFHSRSSGRCRRVEGYLAQVLQRRRNHETFKLYRVEAEERSDLVRRFGVDTLPTILVVQDKVVSARIVAPRGCREIEAALGPWLK